MAECDHVVLMSAIGQEEVKLRSALSLQDEANSVPILWLLPPGVLKFGKSKAEYHRKYALDQEC